MRSVSSVFGRTTSQVISPSSSIDKDSSALTRGTVAFNSFGRADGAGTTSGLAKREQILVLAARIALIASAKCSAAAEEMNERRRHPAYKGHAVSVATFPV